MDLGESGVTPRFLDTQYRMIFWANLSKPCNTQKLSTVLFRLFFKLCNANIFKSPWIKAINMINDIVEGCGFPGIWVRQVIPCSIECFKLQIKQNLKDQFIHKWSSQVNQNI